jgi:hypothetical protein
MTGNAEKLNLLGMSLDELEALFADFGEKPYRARQLLQWMYQRGVTDFDAMTDFSKSLRVKLAERAAITLPRVDSPNPRMARSNGCLPAVPGSASRLCTFPSRRVAPCAFRRR